MGDREVRAFLSHLAVRSVVSASTQNQALGALVFLYKHVLQRPLGDLGGTVRAQMPERLPSVLSRSEVRAVLASLRGTAWLVVALLYGAGLRLSECLELRVKDLDFERRQIVVRRGKGGKDRAVPLPAMVIGSLEGHLHGVRETFDADGLAGARDLEPRAHEVGVALGLVISSLVADPKTAANIVPLVLIPQIIMGGALIKYEDMNRNLGLLYSFSHWFSEHPNSEKTRKTESKLQVPLVCQFIAMRWSYEEMIVAQAKLNPLTKRQDRAHDEIQKLAPKAESTQQRVHRYLTDRSILTARKGTGG